MKTTYRALFVHWLRCVAFMFVSLAAFALVSPYLPRWLFIILFFAWGIFLFFPVVLAVGPVGRRFGKAFNEAAVAKAKAEREALGPRAPGPGGRDG